MNIYFIRHSGPFVKYCNEEKLTWDEFNTNMILSVEGEERAKKLTKVKELNGIKKIYASTSSRAIATAKYVAELNNTKIALDNRINELTLGIEYLKDLPEDFTLNQFNNRDFKMPKGESFSELSARFNSFVNEVVQQNEDCILVVHGILLINYLSEISNLDFDGQKVRVEFNHKVVIDRKLNNPDVFKITYNNKKVIDIKNILI